MLWGEKIPITEEINQTSGPAMNVCRFFGLFPLAVQKHGVRLYLNWSPRAAIYSFALGIIFLILSWKGYLDDAFRDRSTSIRMRAEADVFITGSDILAVTLIVVFGIFVAPFKYGTFLQFVRCFYEVDAIIPPQDVKQARRLSIIMMSIILSVIFSSLLIDFIMYLETAGERSGKYFIFKCYTPFYFLYHIMFAYHYLYWHLVYCIYRRMKLLNEYLEQESFKHASKVVVNNSVNPLLVKVRSKNSNLMPNELNSLLVKYREITTENTMILKLITVYLRMCDAVQLLNELLGINTAVTLVGILFHLILTPYFLIMGVYRDNKDITFVIMQAAWCFIHYGRLMLIAQPCYVCLLQVKKTKSLVLKMLSYTNINEGLKFQLRKFTTILNHRKFEFTADGLISLDRVLVATIFSAVTTYLIVLVQVAESENVNTKINTAVITQNENN